MSTSTLPRLSPIVQIKAGREQPPIFITHGLSGEVRGFELARHIRTGHPIYKIEAKGLDGREEPLENVEDMAKSYLAALEELSLCDPYILIGYSFGGLVALEMAQRLLENGKRIALLVLLDAYPHPRFMRGPERLRLLAGRIRGHANQMWQLPLAGAFSYFVRGLKRRFHFALRDQDTPGLSVAEAARQRVKQKAQQAFATYQPRFYPGKINFVTTEVKTFFPADPARVWKHLAAELEVEVVPGDHLNVVTTQFETLASVLTRYIKQVTSA